jgi:hypothetical protein
MNSVAKRTMSGIHNSGNIDIRFLTISSTGIWIITLFHLDEIAPLSEQQGVKNTQVKFIINAIGQRKIYCCKMCRLFDADGNYVMTIMCLS